MSLYRLHSYGYLVNIFTIYKLYCIYVHISVLCDAVHTYMSLSCEERTAADIQIKGERDARERGMLKGLQTHTEIEKDREMKDGE